MLILLYKSGVFPESIENQEGISQKELNNPCITNVNDYCRLRI